MGGDVTIISPKCKKRAPGEIPVLFFEDVALSIIISIHRAAAYRPDAYKIS